MLIKYKYMIASFLRSRGKHRFISQLKSGAKVLDVGCGNASVLAFKKVNSDIHYTGIDIADYNQTIESKNAMDNYHIFDANNFSNAIDELDMDYDAVICSHNIEHCNDRSATLLSILKRLKAGGKLYLSFPCDDSINYPNRHGTLNYYDDNTHKEIPPNFEQILSTLKTNGFHITFKAKKYRPLILFLIGMVLEPISKIKKTVVTGTWEFYGFESIIHAIKKS